MKTLVHIDGVKIVQGLASGAAWGVIIAAGMILGTVIAAQAAPAVPEFADYHQTNASFPIKETPPSRTEDKGRWNFVKIGDVQKDGKTPIARFEF